jgi:alkylhydroperoxidase family enzyme
MDQLGSAETGTSLSADLVRYVDTVLRYAPEVTDQDIKDLLAAGWSEAEVFEVTVAASVIAGYSRLRIAWEALWQAQGNEQGA